MKNIIIILICLLLILCLVNLLKTKYTKCESSINEYYDGKIRKFKVANPGYGKIVSVDDNGNLNSFEFPRGIIVAWSGVINKIPDGWALCDGKTADVPDLRGRFILGANSNTNKNSLFLVNEIGSSGGKEKALLKHKHQYFQSISDGDDWKGGYNLTYPNGGNTTYVLTSDNGESDGDANKADYRNTPDTSEVGDENTLPPYYALAYIMKL
jgi:hypothetical protein